ncbi:MAG: NAD(+)/NADH kinase [Phycisphaerales bacterium]|nr:NAD(+)/NADH kinase [Phycisphaerales bacterium]
MARRVLLLINRSKTEICRELDRVRVIVSSAGGQIVGERDAFPDGPVSLSETNGAEVVMILGGDGTILSQARRFAHLRLPLLGLNFGKLGMLAQFDLETLSTHAGAIFGDCELDLLSRWMIEVRVRRRGVSGASAGEPETIGAALNDAVITAGAPFRMIEAVLSIDGQSGPTAMGDGVVVSTPIGSTAYNASAGGPILAPDVDALVITPIAAQSLSFRPVVVRGGSTISLTMTRVNSTPDGSAGTSLVLDGQVAARLGAGDEVLISAHPQPVIFVRNPTENYWATLVHKMHWAEQPRFRGE